MVRKRIRRAMLLAAALVALGLASSDVHAQFFWDPNQTPTIPSGGSGTWDKARTYWSDGRVDWIWSTNAAIFSAPGGIVTLTTPIDATGITFNAGGYTIANDGSAADMLRITNGTITQSASVTGLNEISAPIHLNGTTVNVNGGTLRVSNTAAASANSIISSTFNLASRATLDVPVVAGVSALGNGTVMLNGGTFQIDPVANGTAGAFNSRFVSYPTAGSEVLVDANFLASPIGGSPSAMTGQTTVSPSTSGIDFNPNLLSPAPLFYSGGPSSGFAALFSGAIDINNAGQYVFSLSTVGSARLYIDNRLVVNDDGPNYLRTFSTPAMALSAGLHEFQLKYAQGPGASQLVLRYSGADTLGASIPIPGSAFSTMDPIAIGNNVTVTQNSTIELNGTNFTQVGFGTLAFQGAPGSATSLTISGDPSKSLHFANTALEAGATNIINTATDVFTGLLSLNGSGGGTVLAKTGPGRLTFDNTTTAPNLNGATIDVREGSIDIADRSGPKTYVDPIGTATIQLNGGALYMQPDYQNFGINNPLVVTKAGGTIVSTGDSEISLGNSIPTTLNGDLNISCYRGAEPFTSGGLVLGTTLTGSGNIHVIAGPPVGSGPYAGGFELWGSSPNWGGAVTVELSGGSVAGVFKNATDEPFGPNPITMHDGEIDLLDLYGNKTPVFTPGNDVIADGDFAIGPWDAVTYQMGNLRLSGSRTVTIVGKGTGVLGFNSATLGGNTQFNLSGTLTLGSIGESAPSGLTASGAGTLVVSHPSSYSGPTSITNLATIRIGSDNALPTASSLTFGGGTLDLNGANQTIATLSGSNPNIINGLVTNTATGLSILTLTGNSSYSGIISDGGSGKFVALSAASGRTVLTGPSTFSGGTTIAPGATVVAGPAYRSSPLGMGPVTLAGGRLALQGQQQVAPSSEQQGLRTEIFNITPVPVFDSNTNFASLTALSAHLAGNTPAISIQSTAGGKDNFDFSNVRVSNGSVTGTYTTQATFGTAPSASNDTTADYGFSQATSYEVRFSGYIDVPQAGTATFSTTSDDGSVIWLDNLDTPVVNNNFFQAPVTRANTYTFATAGLHPITIAFYQGNYGAGLLVNWTPPGSSTSHTLLNSETLTGTLEAAPLQTYANDVNVTADSSIDVSNSLNAVMGNLTIGSNTLSVTSADATGSSYSLRLGAVTLSGNATFDVANSAGGGTGELTLGAIAGGTNGITKTNAGMLTLTGASTYTGPTLINSGSVIVNGSLGATTVSISKGATLGGAGSVGGPVTVLPGGIVAPSLDATLPVGSPLTMKGDVAFADGSTKLVLDIAPDGSASDQVLFGGAMVLNDAQLIIHEVASAAGGNTTRAQSSATGSSAGPIWVLDGLAGSSPVAGFFSYDGQTLANGATFTDGSGNQYEVEYNAAGDPNGTGNDVLLKPTPEPGALSLLLLAGGAGLLRRHRRGSTKDTKSTNEELIIDD